jgi:hypothetical protein
MTKLRTSFEEGMKIINGPQMAFNHYHINLFSHVCIYTIGVIVMLDFSYG